MSELTISKGSAKHADDFIRVATLEELRTAGMVVVGGARCPLLVIYDGGKVFALDNRCPHLGFPLHRGSIEDGIVTCHWHHARFDLASGCTFDLWADDVPTAAVEVRDGVVWVCADTRYTDGDAHWRNRLREGLEQNIGLVLAKSVLGLIGEGVDYRTLVRDGVLFGARNRDAWGIGLTILTALGNLIPSLPEDETYLALYHGISRVARDCDGASPRRDRQLDDLPRGGGELRDAFLTALDRQGEVKTAGRLVARYLKLGHSVEPLIATLARAVLREDSEFHTYQMLEASVQQYRQWGESTAGRHVLIAVARYVAAHSPTERAELQTAMVARRLSLGQAVHEEAGDDDAQGTI